MALVSACSCANVYSPNYACQGKFECNGGTEVFGWGENSGGQITGDLEFLPFIDSPHLVRQFSNKNIVGVTAKKRSSLAFDYNGNIYEWGGATSTGNTAIA